MKKEFLILLSLCPFGVINDPFPGQCVRFIDDNKNGFCDNSQFLPQNSLTNNYHLFPILLTLSLVYGASIFLVHRELLSLTSHRKIWNVFLLISFLISAILGILLIMKINYNWQIPISNSLFWHVEAGIAMTTISVFHILWHLNYFRKILRG